MRSRSVCTLVTTAVAAMLAGGAAVATAESAVAAPPAHTSVTVPAKHCTKVKGHYTTVTHHGKIKKVWVKPYKVCYKR